MRLVDAIVVLAVFLSGFFLGRRLRRRVMGEGNRFDGEIVIKNNRFEGEQKVKP